jgi:fused signal recognition particle receptor
MSLVDQFKKSLARSRTGFIVHLRELFTAGELNDLFYEELEETLISGDVGVQTSMQVVKKLKTEAGFLKLKERNSAKDLLLQLLIALISSDEQVPEITEQPYVILLVGVNGSGKTTSAAKLANLFRKQGKKVLLVAGDTFRAAAVEQIEIWSERVGVELIKQQSGSDPSALFFDAINSARARKIDIVIGDTAGRLHSRYNLMEELNKIYRVIGRNMQGAPHQVLLVVDATTGQNAIAQAVSFNETLPLSGLILTKLDGTARGGIVIGIQDALKIPVRYVGTGEKMDDLAPFNAADFVHALLEF